MWESVVQFYSQHWARWQGSASCCWALVYYCFFFFLPFTRLEARPAPELIGLWSRVKTPELTEPDSFLQAEAGEVTAKVFQVKDHPRKSCFYTTGHPLWCGRFCPTGTSTQRVFCLHVIYLWFISYLWSRWGEEHLKPKIKSPWACKPLNKTRTATKDLSADYFPK